jgi:hypothetical protein
MGLAGEALGVDLYRLVYVARNDLPSLADIYHECARRADVARSGLAAAMNRPAHFDGTLDPSTARS